MDDIQLFRQNILTLIGLDFMKYLARRVRCHRKASSYRKKYVTRSFGNKSNSSGFEILFKVYPAI